MDLRTASGVFVIAVAQLRCREILPDLDMRCEAVRCLERFVHLVGIELTVSNLASCGRDAIRMEFELKDALRCSFGRIDLDFVKVDREGTSLKPKDTDQRDG